MAAIATATATTLSAHLSLSSKSLYLSNYPSLPTFTLSGTHRISCCVNSNNSNSYNNANLQTNSGSGGDHLRIIFAAGGTGGRIYPAVAIADELITLNPNAQILFLGTPTGIESSGIPSAGYEFASVPAVRLARPLVSPLNLFFPYRLIKSMIRCWRKLTDFHPHIVVGTGGYVSFPICLTAAIKGIKVAIQEQNSVPGIANRVLSYVADVVFVAFNSTVDCFPNNGKCVVVGNPVRSSLRRYVSKAAARSHFFPKSAEKKAGDSEEEDEEKEKKVVLILGGSLGANSINIAMLNLYYQMLSKNKNLFLIWQTGYETYNEMESLVRNHPQLFLSPFLRSMDLAYAAADLIISRAGAMTCSEILATGKPTILIPSPNIAEGNQIKNASLMADLTGLWVITEDELDSTTLGTAIQEILEDESKMAEMRERALKAAKPDAAVEIARHIISLVNLSTVVKEK